MVFAAQQTVVAVGVLVLYWGDPLLMGGCLLLLAVSLVWSVVELRS
ncbi:hypothetical protein JCM30237_18060 [Halolamina litorea]|uniref:Uncharacterized protein n=1 Tax=Halolamina litorea TaxID=1515593 RepID=A0ABD6BSD0_9EURY|nr:hypothetical protein [Halolamina litorea]